MRVLSFLATIMVVCLHSQLYYHSNNFNTQIQYFISGRLCSLAVPIFFLFSGFWFFFKIDKFTFIWYSHKLKKRLHTLCLPYLLWSILGFISVYLIKTFYNESFNSIADISSLTLSELSYTLLWKPVGAYPLWFIRDLYIIIIFSPIIYLLIRYSGLLFIALFTILWMSNIVKCSYVYSMYFFSLGSYLSIYHKAKLEQRNCNYCLTIGVSWFILCIMLQYYDPPYYLHSFSIILGIFCLWKLYDSIPTSFILLLNNKKLLSSSFFIYAFHEPLLTIIKSIGIHICSHQIFIFFLYFFAPFTTILIALTTANIISSYFPNMYSILCGGRT